MSFSFRNLFAQDRPEGGEPPGGAPANPFSASVEKPANPFSASAAEPEREVGQAPVAANPESRGFEPNPQPTNRGSFEALFAGREMGASPVAPQVSGRLGRYSIREMIPFLPPSLVSLDHLPLDKSIEVPLPADGGTEVKLSVIQSVCPEIFATEITPLNDSEVTLPPVGRAPEAAPEKGGIFAGLAMGAKREPRGLFGKRVASPASAAGAVSNPFSEGANPFSAADTTKEPIRGGGESPFANPFSAAVVKEESSGFVNPFSSPTVAEAAPVEEPTPAPVEESARKIEEEPAPVAQGRSSDFGFPAPQSNPASLFGAFGSAPRPAEVVEEPATAFGGFGKAVEEKPFGGGFSGDLPTFAKPVWKSAEREVTPSNVSLTPDAEPEKTPEPSPAPESSTPLPTPPVTGADDLANPFGSPPKPFASSPFSGEPWMASHSEKENPFGDFGTPEAKSEPEVETGDPFAPQAETPAPMPAEPKEVAAEVTESPRPAADDLWSGSFPASLFGESTDSPGKVSPAVAAPSMVEPLETRPVEAGKPVVESAPAAQDAGDRVVFSLRDVLLPMSARTGIDFSSIPPRAKVRLPMSLIEPQLATGEVALRIADLSRHTDPESAMLLKRIDPLLVVALPQNELFHQLQDLAPELLPASGEMDLEAEFSTLFASEAASDAGLSWLSPTTMAAAPEPVMIVNEKVAAETEPENPEVEAGAGVKESLPAASVETGAEVGTEVPMPKPAPKRVISVTRTSTPAPKPVEPTSAARAEKSASGAESMPRIPTTTPVISASAAPKPVVPKKADPFESFNIPGPLPMGKEAPEAAPTESKSTREPVDPFSQFPSASSPREGGRDLGDPFAPLPTRKASPKSAEVGHEPESGGFFDDLDQFSDASTGGGEEAERKAETSAGSGVYASLDDLEPFRPDATRAWPTPVAPPKPAPEPVAEEKITAPAAPAPKVAAVEESADSDDAGGFFDELEADRSPAVEAPEKARPVPAVPPAKAVATPKSVSLRDIELRAVFGTNEEFTYRRVADLTANLPGVMACAIVGPDIVVQAPRGREGGDLASRAGALARSARELAEATGMANSETFTFHTDSGVISLFTHGECCLTVSHAEGQFDPGVREKLILVARGLPGLEN